MIGWGREGGGEGGGSESYQLVHLIVINQPNLGRGGKIRANEGVRDVAAGVRC